MRCRHGLVSGASAFSIIPSSDAEKPELPSIDGRVRASGLGKTQTPSFAPYRELPVQGQVTAVLVVEPLNEVRYDELCILVGASVHAVHEFAFHGGEERPAKGVVGGLANASDRRSDTSLMAASADAPPMRRSRCMRLAVLDGDRRSSAAPAGLSCTGRPSRCRSTALREPRRRFFRDFAFFPMPTNFAAKLVELLSFIRGLSIASQTFVAFGPCNPVASGVLCRLRFPRLAGCRAA